MNETIEEMLPILALIGLLCLAGLGLRVLTISTMTERQQAALLEAEDRLEMSHYD